MIFQLSDGLKSVSKYVLVAKKLFPVQNLKFLNFRVFYPIFLVLISKICQSNPTCSILQNMPRNIIPRQTSVPIKLLKTPVKPEICIPPRMMPRRNKNIQRVSRGDNNLQPALRRLRQESKAGMAFPHSFFFRVCSFNSFFLRPVAHMWHGCALEPRQRFLLSQSTSDVANGRTGAQQVFNNFYGPRCARFRVSCNVEIAVFW